MKAQEPVAIAWRVARRFLSRWGDPYTRMYRDDLAQEAAVEAWRRRGTLRRPECHAAFVRTISRRMRLRALRAAERCAFVSIDQEPDLGDELMADAGGGERMPVAGFLVDKTWLLEQVDQVLARLPPLNRAILLGFYEGFSCGELADRYAVGAQAVKTKLFRSRRRIKRAFEGRVRRLDGGGMDPARTTDRSTDTTTTTTKRSRS